jgi:cell division protease FtsH
MVDPNEPPQHKAPEAWLPEERRPWWNLQDEQEPQGQQRQRRPLSKFTWLIVLLILLITWNAWTFWPGKQSIASVPYSTFLDQVKTDNVTAVQINGDQISGQFAQPILWPPSTSGSPTTASSTTAATTARTPESGNPQTQNTFSYFQTTFPSAVGDPELMPLLEEHDVEVVAITQSTPWYMALLSVLLNLLPFLLFIGLLIFISRGATQGMQAQSGIFNFGRTKARVYDQSKGQKSAVTFRDVAGADEAKADLQEVVDFLKNPEKYRKVGAHMPRGVLLVGPPGTGKTLLAKAVAGEADVPFFSISASEFVEMFVGVGASRVRDLFDQARAAAPSIVFVDELDAVGRRRGAGLGTVNDEREQTLNQLLVAMDGFEENLAVIVLAATNRPDVLDPALLRPGRFDRQVVLALPDRPGREAILHIHARDLPLSSDVDLALLARSTTGFSGADLANLCNEAALKAAQRNQNKVTAVDFNDALDKIVLGDKRNVLMGPEDRRVIAYHEAGHALVAWLTPLADAVHRVTVIPHGRALGATEQRPQDDRYNYSRSYLMARVTVMLGGRASEELAIGDITTGAENDLRDATNLVRRMVTEWGMSDVGLAALENNEAQPFLGYELARGRHYSESMASYVDRQIERLLAERYECARQLLSQHSDKLDRLVAALLQEDTIDQQELETLLGPRALPEPEGCEEAANLIEVEPGLQRCLT